MLELVQITVYLFMGKIAEILNMKLATCFTRKKKGKYNSCKIWALMIEAHRSKIFPLFSNLDSDLTWIYFASVFTVKTSYPVMC